MTLEDCLGSVPVPSVGGAVGLIEFVLERRMERGEQASAKTISQYFTTFYTAIASETLAAQRLVELRDRWLNPPEWVEWVDELVPGYPKRPVARDEHAVKALKKRATRPAVALPGFPTPH